MGDECIALGRVLVFNRLWDYDFEFEFENGVVGGMHDARSYHRSPAIFD